MNKQKRKRLSTAKEMISTACGIIEDVRDDEQESYDNLPEGIQESNVGVSMEENIDILTDAIDYLNSAVEEMGRLE